MKIIKKFFSIFRSYCIHYQFDGELSLNGFRMGKGYIITDYSKIQVGKKVNIGRDAVINCVGKKNIKSLTIGSNIYIGRHLQLNAYKSVIIEDDVVMADRVYISDASHNSQNDQAPIINQGTDFYGNIHIKQGCWIGIGACIMPGVTIGRNAIVGANAVVANDVPDYSKVGGVPAKILGEKKVDPDFST